ncbi:2-keto-3-deoxygluconate permease [Longispora sp. K20-0274]|uniref:2-keto-3-deoxygluconate permease n=1 Tax=Longispora sp. K20-0274 TaxID=3088255 RepID=UPI00399C2055
MIAPPAPTKQQANGQLIGRFTRWFLALPGLPVLLPMLLGAELGTTIGDRQEVAPVTGLLAQTPLPCIGVLLFVIGAQVPVKQLPALAGRTVTILTAATALPALLVLGYGVIFGARGALGVPLLTVACSGLSVSNNLWVGVVRGIGDSADVAAGCVAAVVSSGPLVPLLVLAVWKRQSTGLPWALALAAVLLLSGGLLAGVILPACKAVLACLTTPLLIVMSVAMGWAIPLDALAREAPAGIVVAVTSGLVTGGTAALLYHRLLHRPAAIGWAASAPAGVSVTVPTMIAIADPSWSQWAPVATAQTAAAVLTGIALTTFLGTASRPRPTGGS